jgi:hypothetical protein
VKARDGLDELAGRVDKVLQLNGGRQSLFRHLRTQAALAMAMAGEESFLLLLFLIIYHHLPPMVDQM